MFTADIKERTRQQHIQLEKLMVRMMRGIHSKPSYAKFLTLLLSYHQPLEEGIYDFIGDRLLPDHRLRRKSAALINEIRLLDSVYQEKEECSELPEVQDVNDAFGVAYVLEGSTLGGPIIAKMIDKQLKEAHHHEFFLCYGDNTQLMWERFKTALQADFDGRDEERIIFAANNTFHCFYNWIQRHERIEQL